MYYLVVFWFGIAISTGLILGKKIFFRLVANTLALLNAMLSTNLSDEVRQRMLINRLGKLVVALLLVVLISTTIAIVSLLPAYLYVAINQIPEAELDLDSVLFFGVLMVSSILPFVVLKFLEPKRDYTDWSILLHRIIFNNDHVAKGLFNLEKKFYSSKLDAVQTKYVIVSGLARAGTTALTTLLFSTGKFHSLSYANMPMLLSPNLWGKFYRPKVGELRERSHGDRVLFGHNTVEALEEFFWSVQLNNSYVTESTLLQHEISPELNNEYLLYQSLVKQKGSDTLYLAKNNNFVLRYLSLRKVNPDFLMVILFRNPVEHAYSLLNQHKRYTKFQTDDTFVREYMGWLGHFEFGLDQKHFDFSSTDSLKAYDPMTINYWLRIWIDYYSFVISIPSDPQLVLIEYADFLNDPTRTLSAIGNKLDIELSIDRIENFENKKDIKFDGDTDLHTEAYRVHQKLQSIKANGIYGE